MKISKFILMIMVVFCFVSCEANGDQINDASRTASIAKNSSSSDIEEADKLKSLSEIPLNDLAKSCEENDPDYKYWTEDGTKILLDYCINDELWYRGEYSTLYEMIGKEYTVLSIQVLQQGSVDWENISFLFPDKVNYPADVIVIRQRGPRGYSEPFISEAIELLHI